MDFVVVGLGLGGLGVLLGLLSGAAGARRWRLRPEVAVAAGDASRRVGAARAWRAGGRVLAVGGLLPGLATLVALLLRLSDRAGARLVLAALLVAAVGALVWAVAYARRHHPLPTGTQGGRRVVAVRPPPVALGVGDGSVTASSETPPWPSTDASDSPFPADRVAAARTMVDVAADSTPPEAGPDGFGSPDASPPKRQSPDAADPVSATSDEGIGPRPATAPPAAPTEEMEEAEGVGAIDKGGGRRPPRTDDERPPRHPLGPASTPS